ncbi:unnamed protein product, partial [Tetraodon nigroviridis]
SNALLEQLEARVKELKVWLRDTELLIFNSCLREHKEAAQQLHSFKQGTSAYQEANSRVLISPPQMHIHTNKRRSQAANEVIELGERGRRCSPGLRRRSAGSHRFPAEGPSCPNGDWNHRSETGRAREGKRRRAPAEEKRLRSGRRWAVFGAGLVNGFDLCGAAYYSRASWKVTKATLEVKCLSSEVRARRRGVSSVLKLCQKLLQVSCRGGGGPRGGAAQGGPAAAVHQPGAEVGGHRDAGAPVGEQTEEGAGGGAELPAARSHLPRRNGRRTRRADKDGGAEGGPSSQELSRRTLELLRRLEDIQTPLTRSLSDLALQRSHLPRSPRRLPASLEPAVQESEDSSHLRHHPRVSSATTHGSSGKRCHGNGGGGVDEADAASVSLLVNVSCTEEEQDDSDLLTSSTLTLTEEELGFQEDEEEGLSSASLEEEEEDGPYLLGLDYLKTELQSFIRAPRASSSKPDRRLLDELQCGASLSSTSSTQSSEQQSHTNSNLEEHHQEDHQENQRNRTRSFISRLVDDVENGNVEQSSSRSEEEEDDRLLREESSVFTRRGAAPREEAYVFLRPAGFPPDVPSCTSNAGAPRQELHPFAHKRSSSLVGQLKGELPCHSSSCSSPLQDHKPDDAVQRSASLAAGRTAITIQETFKFSSVVMEEAKREVREVGTAPPPRGRRRCPPACFSHAPSPSPLQDDNVHDFVMEIIDMTSTALRSKGQAEGASQDAGGAQDQAPPLTHIRDK